VTFLLRAKVALVCPREPWYHGGQERVVANIALNLKNDFDIEIYCTGEKDYQEKWNGIPVNVFKGITNGYRYSSKLKKAIRGSRFDIIHAHGFTVHSSYAVSKEKNGAYFVFNPHYHEIGSSFFYKSLRVFYDPIIGNTIFKNVDRIICDSNVEKKWLERKFRINNQIKVIPVGVEIDKIKNVKPYDFENHLIIYVGRLEKYKNIHVLINTMKYLPEDYSLFIIGKGPYKKSLLKLINKLNIEKKVRIISDLNDEEKYRWLNTCDLFINLSEAEAFGITVIEALSAGKPVIVNNKGGLGELASKHSDSIFKINQDSTTSKELTKLIKEKSISPVKPDLDDYRWESICKKLRCIYNELLSEGKI
jgi:glycosyltransferase involved in cell wall biosynthesis